MTAGERLSRIRAGLEEAVRRYEDGEDTRASMRRLARTLAGLDEVGSELRSAADEVVKASGRSMAAPTRELLDRLDSELGPAAEDDAEGGAAPERVALVASPGETTDRVRSAVREMGMGIVHLEEGHGVREALADVEPPVSLAIVDLLLPDRDGRDVILELSESEEHTDLPILALGPGGEGFALARAECRALGAEAFLGRPVDDDLLREEVRRHAGSRARPDDHLSRRGSFTARYRERGRDDGFLVLLAAEAFRSLADEVGSDEADAALREVVDAVAAAISEVELVGRWSLEQIVLVVEGLEEDETAARVREAIAELATEDLDHPHGGRLAGSLSGAVVPAPHPSTLAETVQRAGRVRLGLSSEGSRLTTETEEDSGERIVFLVEDDPTTAALVEHKLEQAGFTLVHMDDGGEAREALPELEFDLAIFDLNLPGTDGFQLIQRVRSAESGADRPIMILSGMSSEDTIVRALEMGADDYVLKPFSPVELTARVRRLLTAGRRSG
jgi:DNA-binding response OmpR family regulator